MGPTHNDCRFLLSRHDPCQESWWFMKLPFCRELILFDHNNKQIVFDGRYCLVDKDFPRTAPTRMRVIVTFQNKTEWLEIKVVNAYRGQNTSTVDVIEGDMEITLFPSHIITLEYELIRQYSTKSDFSNDNITNAQEVDPKAFGHGSDYERWKNGEWDVTSNDDDSMSIDDDNSDNVSSDGKN